MGAVAFVASAAVVYAEADLWTLPFLLCLWCAMAGIFLLISRRPVFSAMLSLTILLEFTIISIVFRQFRGINAFLFDLFFRRGDVDVLGFVASSYLIYVANVVVAIFIGVAACFAIAYFERSQRGARLKGAALTVLAALGIVATVPAGANEPDYYITNQHNATAFFTSMRVMYNANSESGLYPRLPKVAVADENYLGALNCSDQAYRPDIVTVLMESAVPPHVYPEIKASPELHALYNAPGREVHNLRVETYAGSTWLAVAGFMASLSTLDYGWLQDYSTVRLRGRVHHSLPSVLKQCGYKTVVVSPMPYGFSREGQFLTSLGIDDYIDKNAIGSTKFAERDQLYFNAAQQYVRKHRAEDGRPLFIMIMTMTPHSPFHTRMEPDLKVPGEPFGNAPDLDEYLRRLWIQQTDFAAFLRELKADKLHRPTIVAEFGDHQPISTRPLAEARSGPLVVRKFDSIAFNTYYRFTALDTKLAVPAPQLPMLDIAYLAPTLLQAAGLPLTDVYESLLKLRDECRGAFYLCPDRTLVNRHIARLASSGLLDIEERKPTVSAAAH